MSRALDLNSIETSHPTSNHQQSPQTSASSLTLPANARIVLAHENPEMCDHSKAVFNQAGWAAKLRRCASLDDLQTTLNSGEWDLVITYAHSETLVPAVIAKTIQSQPKLNQPALIYMDDSHCPTNATEIMRCGFSDYLSLDESERLIFSASREIFARQNARTAATSEVVIAEAQAKSQLLLNSTADAIAYASDGMLIHVNQPLCDILGFESAEELELQPLIDLVADTDHDSVRTLVKQMSAQQQDEMEPASLELLNAHGEAIALTLNFDSATHEGEACTQIIFRDANNAVAHAEGNTVNTEPAASAHPVAAATVSDTRDTPASELINTIENLEGRGLIGFLSTCRQGQIRKAVGFYQYQKLGAEIRDVVRQALPDTALVGTYMADSWVFALGEDSNTIDVDELGASLCSTINAHLSEATGLKDITFAALGLAKFGIADVVAGAAIDKAFMQCAELQQGSGGYKVFAPRIDNAEGSAALKSALELDRLTLKYQPVIGLQNQTGKHYQGHIYLRNDAGQETSAKNLVEGLGLESENVALDHWVIETAISTLKAALTDNADICLTLPVTASALVADDFYQWIESTIDASGLDARHIIFDFSADKLHDYEQAVALLATRLRAKGCGISLSAITPNDLPNVSTLLPHFVRLSGDLTSNLNADEEHNSKEALKALIGQLKSEQLQCIATRVGTAAELAQLWQTGVPYVQGDYLQSPLSAMNYEFSDIA